MKEQQKYDIGTCQRCTKPNVRRLWGLCKECCKTFEDEFGEAWIWDPIDELMLKMGYEETTKE